MEKNTEKHILSPYEVATVNVCNIFSHDIITTSGVDNNWGDEWDSRKEQNG